MTYADTHPQFTAQSYPHFFRVVPSENEFNEPRLALLKQYNWTRVGTLYQNQARYSLVSEQQEIHKYLGNTCFGNDFLESSDLLV